MINELVKGFGVNTRLFKRDLYNSSPVKFNIPCEVYNKDKRSRGYGKGKFIADENRWLVFQYEYGYKEWFDKWDILTGLYIIEYSKVGDNR